MVSIPSVRLPVMPQDATIGQAMDRLREAGTGGVVVLLDNKQPVVLTASSIRNTLMALGENRDVPLLRVASRAAPTPVARGRFQFQLKAPERTVLASEQDAYAVTVSDDSKWASVVTDPKRTAELSQA